MYRPHHIGGDGIAGGRLGDTEVCHLDFSLFGNNDVLWLDIPVNNMIVMGGFNSHAHLYGNGYRFLD